MLYTVSYFEIKSTIANEKIREIGNLGCLREKLKNMMYKENLQNFLYFSRILLVYFVQLSSSHDQMYTNAFLCISLPKTGVSGRVFDDCDLQRKTT